MEPLLVVFGVWILSILICWGFIEYHSKWAEPLEEHPFIYVFSPLMAIIALGIELGRVAIMPLMGFYRIMTKLKKSDLIK